MVGREGARNTVMDSRMFWEGQEPQKEDGAGSGLVRLGQGCRRCPPLPCAPIAAGVILRVGFETLPTISSHSPHICSLLSPLPGLLFVPLTMGSLHM